MKILFVAVVLCFSQCATVIGDTCDVNVSPRHDCGRSTPVHNLGARMLITLTTHNRILWNNSRRMYHSARMLLGPSKLMNIHVNTINVNWPQDIDMLLCIIDIICSSVYI